MGSSGSSSKPHPPIDPRLITTWKDEARGDKSEIEAALDEIKKIRSKTDIGESRLSRLHQIEKEKAELLNRLSNLASDRMRNQNAKIADLSDTNRPTKLAERFSELYDNEWTDAFTELREKYSPGDQKAIQTLLSILKNCYMNCEKIAKNQRQELGKFLGNRQSKDQSVELRITECQKHIAEITFKDLQQNCEKHIEVSGERKIDKEDLKLEFVQNYCKLCVELTWLMCIQAPPIKLEFDFKKVEISNCFRHYTSLGDEPDFVVWPVIFLHEKGPVLSKGVIQFKNGKKSDQNSANVNSNNKTKRITSPETKSEIKSDNGLQSPRKDTMDATETNVSENYSQGKAGNEKLSNASRMENLEF